MKNRSGKSLIELLVVIVALSAVMLVGGRTLVLLMRADATGGTSLAASQTVTRLAGQFRRDAHASIQAELVEPVEDADDAAPRLHFTMPDDLAIVYSAAPDHIARVELRDSEPQARETYRLPAGDNHFELDAGTATLVHARRTSEPTSRPASALPAREFRIEAGRGRDGRFMNQPSE